jgi:hypothetical protein
MKNHLTTDSLRFRVKKASIILYLTVGGKFGILNTTQLDDFFNTETTKPQLKHCATAAQCSVARDEF